MMKCIFCDNTFELKEKGKTKKYCSRSCVNRAYYQRNHEAILKRNNEWLHANQEKHTKVNREWRQRNPRKAVVQTLTNRAMRNGKIIKQPCEVCGVTKVHAHHPDYSQHYSFVKWLCPAHHKIEHMRLNHAK